ncbi:MAG: DUF1911 domain-containing protein [Pseudomonadota bacterium]|nr:DUF1911 domain-containing protein [Pseudomonadota bacterium]
MVRDKHKDQAYFNEYAEFVEQAAQKRLADVTTFANIGGRAGRAHALVNYAFMNCIYRYSRGDAIEDIRESVWLWVQAKEVQKRVHAELPAQFANTRVPYEKLTLDTVYDALTTMAFSRALRFTPAEIRRLLDAIGHAGKDALMDEAARALGDTRRAIADKCSFPKVYEPLLQVWRTAAAQQRAEQLQTYADEWIKRIEPIHWSGSLQGGEGAYFGYWCFEVALTAMLLDVSDAGFRANPFYPADLVDAARPVR